MRLTLAYGRGGLVVDLPDGADVLAPRFVPGLPDEPASLAEALRRPIGSPPLRDLVRAGDRVVVVHTDITRPTPNDRILPVLLGELEAAGVRRRDIALLNGLGTHRRQTEAELRALLGEAVAREYRCLQHDAFDEQGLVPLGTTTRGHPVRINRAYLEADAKILTGFIEPHFFAGFSGGPKAVLPSLAGAESVFSNHGAAMIGHPSATWAVTEGNPIWEEMREVALATRPTFLVNVALNAQRAITGVFAGELEAAHREGCRAVAESAMVAVDRPYDVVITTNSGYPLDQNLYQSVKGMSAAAQIVRAGGAIVTATACADGLPAHGQYAALLARAGSPSAVLEMIASTGFSEHDQWTVQVQAQIQQRCEVHVFSDGLTDEQIRRALLLPCRSVEATVAALLDRLGPGARLAVLPEGPQTVPYVRHGPGAGR